MPRSAATSGAGRPSTAVAQNACQVRSWNSGRISAQARRGAGRLGRVVARLVGRLRVGQAGEPELGLGPALAARLAAEPAEVVVDLVPQDHPQPAAEGVAGGRSFWNPPRWAATDRKTSCRTSAASASLRPDRRHHRWARGAYRSTSRAQAARVVGAGPVDQAGRRAGRKSRRCSHGFFYQSRARSGGGPGLPGPPERSKRRGSGTQRRLPRGPSPRRLLRSTPLRSVPLRARL